MFDVKWILILFFLSLVIYTQALQMEGINLAKKIRCFIEGKHMEPYQVKYFKGTPTGRCPCCGKITSLNKDGDWK